MKPRKKDNPRVDWSGFTRLLLAWFKQHKRNLPWRNTQDPYAIWISEVMLQQTQVKTAIPYYLNFLKKFPTLPALAEAPFQEVLKSWEGLGYYSRARHLHSTAKEVRQKYGGNLPNKRDALLSLAGIGPYTASAVASIAFGEASPVVDGNVWRVFSRLLADSSLPDKGKTKTFQILTGVIPHQDPSSFNQALMELGSMICLPKNPDCPNCPVQKFCQAFRLKQVDKFPRKPPKKKLPHKHWITLVLQRKDQVILRQRPLRGIWGGLWEFPTANAQITESTSKTALRFAKSLNLNQKIIKPELRSPIPHAFSHFKVTIHPFWIGLAEAKTDPDLVWTDIHQNPYPMPKPHLKILEVLKQQKAPLAQTAF